MSESFAGSFGSQTPPRLVVTLRDGMPCELRTDRLVVGIEEYRLSELAWAGVVIDPTVAPVPGAPPPPAVLLRLRNGRDVLLSPAEPPAAWQLLGAIFQSRPDLRVSAPSPSPTPGPAPAYPPPPPSYGYGYGYGYQAPPGSSNSDTMLAGLSHLSIFFAPVILPLIVWLATRQSSPYTSRQGKQAFFFHLAFVVVQIVLVLGWFITFPLVFFAWEPRSAPSVAPSFFLFVVALWAVYGALWLFEVIFSIVGAVQAFQGKPFHYPLLGWL